MSRDDRYNTIRSPLTQEIRILINNIARINAGTNSDIDIVDAKGRALVPGDDNSETSTTTNNLNKNAHLESPIQNEDSFIPARNLSRDNVLKT